MTKRHRWTERIDNGLSRRDMLMAGAAQGLVLTLAQVLKSPALAAEAAALTETVSLQTPSGRKVSAAFATPDAAAAPGLLLIHEFWGLNNQIKAVTAECARLGYAALAVDLYGGEVAPDGDRDTGRRLMGAVKTDEAIETLAAWTDWLRASPRVKGGVGTCGWCFGGGWSLAASLVRPVEATVIYYGRVDRSAQELAALKGPVLGHFAERDANINHEMVSGFEAAMKEAGKSATIYWYDAEHGFANPTTARYDEADATLAWERTLAFLDASLRA
jgi:carboxymethylenebutenolidase